MQKNTAVWVGAGVIIAAILVGSVFYFHSRNLAMSIHTQTNATSTSSTTTSFGTVAITTTGGGTIQIVPISKGIQPPSLAGTIQISSSLPPDAVAALRTQEETLIPLIKANPLRVDLWLQLGVDRKIGGDYQGAITAWQYVAAAAPVTLSYVAYGDLGDLYMNFLKDYPKAETNYLAAIKINPHVIDYYRSLYTLYRYDYKTNTTAAANILVQGLQANPGNPDLLGLQKALQNGQ